MRRNPLTYLTATATIFVSVMLTCIPAGAATGGHHGLTSPVHATPALPSGHITSPVPPHTGGYIEYLDRTGNAQYGQGSVQPLLYTSGPEYGLRFDMTGSLADGTPYVVNVMLATPGPVEAGQTYGTGLTGNVVIDGAGQYCDSLQAPDQAAIEIDELTVSADTITSLAAQIVCTAALTTPINFYFAAAYNAVPTTPHQGYYTFESDGLLSPFGNDNFLIYLGDLSATALNQPIVGMAQTPDGGGYWMVAADGGIFAYGDARFYGSTGNIHLNKPIVGMAATPDGKGYWLVASDGGIFAYGDATFYGSTGNIQLNKPVVGMTPTPDGKGYWFVASDGGIFNYGDATFHGSAGSLTLAQPIVGMSITQTGSGYWLVASDGGIFSYNASYHGSIPAQGGSVDDVVGLSTLPGISI